MISVVVIYLLIGVACHGIFEGAKWLEDWSVILGGYFNVALVLWWLPLLLVDVLMRMTFDRYDAVEEG
jgi:uncharacterized membrane protein